MEFVNRVLQLLNGKQLELQAWLLMHQLCKISVRSCVCWGGWDWCRSLQLTEPALRQWGGNLLSGSLWSPTVGKQLCSELCPLGK